MNDFIHLVFSTVNLPLSLLLIILILYWIFTMISGIDFDLDFDVDIDIDTDFDLDMDAGIEGGNADFEDVASTEINQEDIVGRRQKPLKWWQVFLIYFNFVGLPFMFTFTVFVFAWWFITMVTTDLTFSANHWVGVIIFILAIIPALIFTKIFTTPFKAFFAKLNKDGDQAIDFLGRKGTSLSTIKDDKMGRAEIMVNGSPMNLYIKSLHGEEIAYHQSILIIKESSDKNFFYVESYNE